jgi:hypothetical protein
MLYHPSWYSSQNGSATNASCVYNEQIDNASEKIVFLAYAWRHHIPRLPHRAGGTITTQCIRILHENLFFNMVCI